MESLPPGGQKASSSHAPLIAAAAAVAGVVASRTTLGKVAVLAAAGTAAFRWLNNRNHAAAARQTVADANQSAPDVFIMPSPPEAEHYEWAVEEDAPPAEEPFVFHTKPAPSPVYEPAPSAPMPVTQLLNAAVDEPELTAPAEYVPFSVGNLHRPEASAPLVLPEPEPVVDSLPLEPLVSEVQAEVAEPEEAAAPEVTTQDTPSWVLSMEPLPVVQESSITELNASLAESDIFSPIPGYRPPTGTISPVVEDVPAAKEEAQELPAEEETPSYIPPLAIGGDIPDAVDFESAPEEETTVEPVAEVQETPEPEVIAEPVVASAPVVEPEPEPVVAEAPVEPEPPLPPSGIRLPASNIARLLKELAERIPPAAPGGAEPLKTSLSPIAKEVAAETPVVAEAATAPAEESPAPAAAEESGIVSAAKLFADLKPAADAAEPAPLTTPATPPPLRPGLRGVELPKSTGPFSPKTRPRAMITVPPAAPNPQRKNWLAWWK